MFRASSTKSLGSECRNSAQAVIGRMRSSPPPLVSHTTKRGGVWLRDPMSSSHSRPSMSERSPSTASSRWSAEAAGSFHCKSGKGRSSLGATTSDTRVSVSNVGWCDTNSRPSGVKAGLPRGSDSRSAASAVAAGTTRPASAVRLRARGGWDRGAARQSSPQRSELWRTMAALWPTRALTGHGQSGSHLLGHIGLGRSERDDGPQSWHRRAWQVFRRRQRVRHPAVQVEGAAFLCRGRSAWFQVRRLRHRGHTKARGSDRRGRAVTVSRTCGAEGRPMPIHAALNCRAEAGSQ